MITRCYLVCGLALGVVVGSSCGDTRAADPPTMTASRDTIEELDTVTFTARIGKSGAIPIGWSWTSAYDSLDKWTRACAGADSVCTMQLHGSGTTYFLFRGTSSIDSIGASVVAAAVPNASDVSMSDANSDAPGPPEVGCYRFQHSRLNGNLARLRIDTLNVHLTNGIYGVRLGGYARRLEPWPALAGLDTTSQRQPAPTHDWIDQGNTIELLWATPLDTLRANLRVRPDSLIGHLWASAGKETQQVDVVGRRTNCDS